MNKKRDIPVAKSLPAIVHRLQDFLHRKPVTVVPETPIGWAMEIMAENKIGSIIVTEPEGGKPVGIFTLKDVLCRVAIPGIDLRTPIESVMTRNPLSISGSVAIGQAAREMGRLGIRHLLVTDREGALAGVVSRNDVYDWMCDSCASIRRAKSARKAAGEGACSTAPNEVVAPRNGVLSPL